MQTRRLTWMLRASAALFVTTLYAAPARIAHAQVTAYDAFKVHVYEQVADDTQPTTPILYVADSIIGTSAPGDYAAANLNGVLNHSLNGTEWDAIDFFATEGELQSALPPNSTWTFSLTGAGQPSATQNHTVGPDGFPTTVPYLTGSSYSDLINVDPTLPLTLSINDYAGSGANSGFFEIYELLPGGDDGPIAFETFVSSGQTSVMIPADAMQAGKTYRMEYFISNLSMIPADPAGFNAVFTLGYDITTIVEFSTAGACPADFNGDGEVDGSDLANLLVLWGPCQ